MSNTFFIQHSRNLEGVGETNKNNQCNALHSALVKMEEPYVLQEKGWGEFDMRVVLYFTNDITDPQVLLFDLNFALSNYSTIHTVEFHNASPELKQLLSDHPFSPRKGGKKPMSNALDEPNKQEIEEFLPLPLDQVPLSPGFTDTSINFDSTPSSSYLKSPSAGSNISRSPSPLNHSRIVDRVQNINDVYNLNPIHSADIADHLREEWGIPNVRQYHTRSMKGLN